MKYKSIPILLLTLLLTIQSKTQAQELTVTHTDIILDLNGNIIPGSITLNFDENIFPNHIYELTTLSVPMGSSCVLPYSAVLINDDEFTIPNIGAQLGEPCAGEYCYQVVKNPGTDQCEIDFCVYINYCELTVWKGGKVTLSCKAISNTPPAGSFTSPDDGANEISSKQTVQLNSTSGHRQEPIDKIIGFDLVNVYPIPFNQEIQIELEASFDKSVTISLVDLYGRTLLEEKYNMTKGMSIFTLSTEQSLPEGLYLVQITDQYGHQISKQLTHFKQ